MPLFDGVWGLDDTLFVATLLTVDFAIVFWVLLPPVRARAVRDATSRGMNVGRWTYKFPRCQVCRRLIRLWSWPFVRVVSMSSWIDASVAERAWYRHVWCHSNSMAMEQTQAGAIESKMLGAVWSLKEELHKVGVIGDFLFTELCLAVGDSPHTGVADVGGEARKRIILGRAKIAFDAAERYPTLDQSHMTAYCKAVSDLLNCVRFEPDDIWIGPSEHAERFARQAATTG